ncbi:uncharacterized protein LOC131622180 [Vicia villosa]|uniref:uncharacterized protein LOC131622180 n=1 Tax=Vicia villosa TaxID=3911 RepID=UPI00273B50AE|nr:uncharacterized protein LOC131622180 [Vicia villosa]
MDYVPARSSSASRSRLSRTSSSREEEVREEEVGHEEEEIADVHPEHDEDDAQDAGEEDYPGGPSDTSMLIFYHDHVARRVWDCEERTTINSVNHARKIFDLFKPRAQWFNDIVVGSRLGGLCMTRYSIINHDMQGAFAGNNFLVTSDMHIRNY